MKKKKTQIKNKENANRKGKRKYDKNLKQTRKQKSTTQTKKARRK